METKKPEIDPKIGGFVRYLDSKAQDSPSPERRQRRIPISELRALVEEVGKENCRLHVKRSPNYSALWALFLELPGGEMWIEDLPDREAMTKSLLTASRLGIPLGEIPPQVKAG